MDIDLAKDFNSSMTDFTKPQNIADWQTYNNIILMRRKSQCQSKRRKWGKK